MSQPPPHETGLPGNRPAPPEIHVGAMGDDRVGNAQRTTVLDLLGRALEEGFLDLAEYETRLQRVTEGKTVAELYAQVADLPPQFRWDPDRPMPKSREERDKESANAMAVASIALGAAAIPTSLCLGAGVIPGIAALFLARRALRREAGRGRAITGLVLGLVGVALSIGVVLLFVLSPEQRRVS